MARGKLTALEVARRTKRGYVGDGGGLWLAIAKGGTKTWVLRFTRNGRSREMGLGPVEVVSLAAARDLALDARRQLRAGVDPIEHRKAAKQARAIEAAKATTFAEAAERYISAHESSWRNAVHVRQWRSTIATYANPFFGAVSVSSVDTGLLLKALEPIWLTKPETASRLRGRIEAVLDWATARELRAGENPARWRGHLQKLLPPRDRVARVRHHPAMPYPLLPAFMAELRGNSFISARALEFTILVAARTGETLGAKWPEVDLEAGFWTVPAERMKSGRPHRVPLSERARELLRSLPREAGSEFVWLGAKAGQPLSNQAMLELLRQRHKGLTVHGFRSTFKDWVAEQTDYPNEVSEAALAHVIGNKVEAAYRRGDVFEKRRSLMDDWAAFCQGVAVR